ncbi:SPFH domain-containing protein [Streptomyces sp. NPDC087300]|uniref:SPFH domain-containing protein n=1 Tax=Streptomyces sp. NPDC087300 TaxID=3365780 RepID=UPI003809FA20
MPDEPKDPEQRKATEGPAEPAGPADGAGIPALVVRNRHDAIPMDLLFRGDAAELPKSPESPKSSKLSKAQHAPTSQRAPQAPRAPQTSHAPQNPHGPKSPKASGTPDEGRRRPLSPPRPDRELAERRGPACSGWWALLVALLALGGAAWLIWAGGLIPVRITDFLALPEPPWHGLVGWQWAAVGGCGVVALFALGGLTRGRVGSAWTLSLFGRYRGSVRRTGLVWISPLMLRRRVDVRLRHWRSEPMTAVDAQGVELRVVVLVVWQVKDAARALLTVDDHLAYLREQVEAVTARVVSRLPADSFREPADDAPTLRDAEAVGDALGATLAAECRAVGIEVFSARPTRVEYAPEVAAAMQRRQIAAIDAKHRDTVLTSVLDAVDDTVRRLTERGLVALDDYERKALVKDLTVAFYTARGNAVDTH